MSLEELKIEELVTGAGHLFQVNKGKNPRIQQDGSRRGRGKEGKKKRAAVGSAGPLPPQDSTALKRLGQGLSRTWVQEHPHWHYILLRAAQEGHCLL